MSNIIKFLLFFFISNVVLGSELPDELFNIKLLSNVSSLQGETVKSKGVVRIKGKPYIYYKVDSKFYNSSGNFQNIIVQTAKTDGAITSISGESKLTKNECLTKLQEYKIKTESNFKIQFDKSTHQNDTYYSLVQGTKMLALICELKSKATLRLVLGKL
jgi:hypothetical protein